MLAPFHQYCCHIRSLARACREELCVDLYAELAIGLALFAIIALAMTGLAAAFPEGW